MTGIKSGIEITTLSDISSKGSVLVIKRSNSRILNALYCFKNKTFKEELAEKACEIEINKCIRLESKINMDVQLVD